MFNLNDYLATIATACTNSVSEATRITLSMKHDTTGLVIQWFAENGVCFIQERSKSHACAQIGGVMHDRLNREVSRTECAVSLIEHGIALEALRTRPAVQIVRSASAAAAP